MLDIIKSNINLGNYKLLQTKSNKIVIFNIKYDYTRCIYINKIKNKIYINVDKVFDNYLKYKGIERMLISQKKFNKIEDSIEYIQNNIIN